MLRMMASLVLSLIMVLLAGKPVINWLHKLRFGQTIYDLGPAAHKTKQGTPTMGGVMVVAACVICTLVLHPAQWNGVWDFGLAVLAVALMSMLVGFVDDYIKIVKKRNLGLTAKQKIIGQVLVAVLFSVYCYVHPLVGSKVWIPFFNVEWELGRAYIPLMSLVSIFFINSANLQDGLDGLLSGITTMSSIGWALTASFMALAAAAAGSMQLESSYYTLAIFAIALCGAEMGFLRFNFYPAKCFHGDTGSMFVGGAAVGLAMLLRQPFFLLLMGFGPVMSSLSVIIQRTYFKLTHGKRIFKMSPIHHHFELSGWNETQIDVMYWMVTALLSMLAVFSVVRMKL